MRVNRRLLILFLTISLHAINAKAQEAIAISSDPGRDLHIVIIWEPVTDAVRYNIYRRSELASAYPGTPLNPNPIQALADCATIKALFIKGVDSTDWKLVAQGLSEEKITFDPCNLSSISISSERYRRLKVLAKSSIPVSIAAGWAYEDHTVTDGSVYFYKITAYDRYNRVIGTVANDLRVKAGEFQTLAAPINVDQDAGDDAVLISWESVSGAAGYVLERASSPSGNFLRVNESVHTIEIKNNLHGDTIVPAVKGMVDYQRYSHFTGKDTIHEVAGKKISGPANGNTYYYKVKALDLFKRPGSPSAQVGPAVPIDSTAPSVPLDVTTTVDNVAGNVTIRWTQVVRNIIGHWESPDSSVNYKIYRFTSSDAPDSIPSIYLGEAKTIKGLRSRDTIDSDPNLRSTFGNKTWWYRVRAVDLANNISQWSVATSAIVKDITPPDITKNLDTKGYEHYIALKWDPNTEPDIASYVIYRSLCHLGSWVKCQTPGKIDSTCMDWITYDPSNDPHNGERGDKLFNPDTMLPCPCSGPFVFLGEITSESVKRAIRAGKYFFEDHSIPAGSPLCYAYWVKARDSSENVSGAFPLPTEAEQNEIKCERLRDKTPPETALISGLLAQADQIRVGWIGPPTQDTRAYHVYRAPGTDPALEPRASEYKWVGGMTVELPPNLPQVLTVPYVPPSLTTCDQISVQATPWMSEGYFEDKSIKPKLTYWYRVVGIDYDGNESPLDSAVAISTFSFSKKRPDVPIMNPPTWQHERCGVELNWAPTFNPSEHIGFIVYKSNTMTGKFVPIVSSPVQGNSYLDENVTEGLEYWYRIAALMLNGRLSPLCAAQKITP